MQGAAPAPTYEELLEDLEILQRYLRHVKKELKKAKVLKDSTSSNIVEMRTKDEPEVQVS